MAGVKYIGPVLDGSGYAQAARDYVLAIHKAGYPITVSPITFERTRPELGEDGRILRSLIGKSLDYDKVIVHSTPDLWRNFTQQEADKYIIGYTVWETSKLHPVWVHSCNRVREVWVPCEWNLQVFRDSGVQVPLYKIPHAIPVPEEEQISPLHLEGVSPETFVFYSIFQWQERKNPYALLTAYYAAFTGVEDVILVLKTYMRDHAGDGDKIREVIRNYKNYLNLPHFPPVYLIVENFSTGQIQGLHKRGDVFMLLQHSEGWGLPHSEAAAMGKPVITTGYGGPSQFLNSETAYLLNYTLAPVAGMSWSPYYQADQYWADVDMKHAIDTMRHVYHNREEAASKGRKAREYLKTYFSRDIVGQQVVSRLRELDK